MMRSSHFISLVCVCLCLGMAGCDDDEQPAKKDVGTKLDSAADASTDTGTDACTSQSTAKGTVKRSTAITCTATDPKNDCKGPLVIVALESMNNPMPLAVKIIENADLSDATKSIEYTLTNIPAEAGLVSAALYDRLTGTPSQTEMAPQNGDMASEFTVVPFEPCSSHDNVNIELKGRWPLTTNTDGGVDGSTDAGVDASTDAKVDAN